MNLLSVLFALSVNDSIIRHYLELGELKKAEEICSIDTSKYPFLYGEVLYFNYKFERAIEFYNRVQSDSRDANDALSRIILIKSNEETELQDYVTAELLGRQGKFEKGIKILKKLCEGRGDLTPTDSLDKVTARVTPTIAPWALILLVEFLMKMGEEDEALKECANFVKMFPEDAKLPQVFLVRARIYVRLGKIDNARSDYREILMKHPDSAVASIAREELERL